MKVLKVIGILIFLSLSLLVGQAKAQTYVSGPIDQDTTWTEANSPYVVTGDMTVVEGVTLTIRDGSGKERVFKREMTKLRKDEPRVSLAFSTKR